MYSSAELFKQNASTKTKEEYSCLNQFDVIKDNTIRLKPHVALCMN